MLIVIGKIKLKENCSTFQFLRLSKNIEREFINNLNCLHIELSSRDHTFYSISVWNNLIAMKKAAHSGVHLEAMKAANEFSSAIAIHHYQSDEIPTMTEITQKF